MNSASVNNNLIIIFENVEKQHFSNLNVTIKTKEAEYIISPQCNENILNNNNERDETVSDTEEFFSPSEFLECNQNLNNKHDGNTSNIEEVFSSLDITDDLSSNVITSDRSATLTQFSAEPENSHTVTNKDDNCAVTCSGQTLSDNQSVVTTMQKKIRSEKDSELRESSNNFCILTLKKGIDIEIQTESDQNAPQSNSNITKNQNLAVQTDSQQIIRKPARKTVDASIQTDLNMNLNTPKVPETIEYPSQPLDLSMRQIKEIDVGIQVDSEIDISSQELGVNSLDVYAGSQYSNTSQKNISTVLKSQNSTHNPSFNHENIDTDSEGVVNDTDTESDNQCVKNRFRRKLKTNSSSTQKQIPCTSPRITLDETPENLFEIARANPEVSITTNSNDPDTTKTSTDQSTTLKLPKLATINSSSGFNGESTSQDQQKMSNEPLEPTEEPSTTYIVIDSSDDDVIVISSDSESEVVSCAPKNNTEPKNRVELSTTEDNIKRKQSNELPRAAKKICSDVPAASNDYKKPSTTDSQKNDHSKATSKNSQKNDEPMPSTSKNSEKDDSNVEKEMHAIKIRCFRCRTKLDYLFLKRKGKSKHIVICEFCQQRHIARYNNDDVLYSVQRETEVSKK